MGQPNKELSEGLTRFYSAAIVSAEPCASCGLLLPKSAESGRFAAKVGILSVVQNNSQAFHAFRSAMAMHFSGSGADLPEYDVKEVPQLLEWWGKLLALIELRPCPGCGKMVCKKCANSHGSCAAPADRSSVDGGFANLERQREGTGAPAAPVKAGEIEEDESRSTDLFAGLSLPDKRRLLALNPLYLQGWLAKTSGTEIDIVEFGQGDESDADLMRKLSLEELEEAIEIRRLSDEATAAADRRDHSAAIAAFEQVVKRAPWDSIAVMSIGANHAY